MTIKKLLKSGCLAGTFLVMIPLLNGPPPMLLAQTAPPPGETPRQEEQPPGEATPPRDTTSDGNQVTQDRGSAYRKQKDNLKSFEPSEEIRVDKAVDFPADI